ncbi:hypothetical protein RND81_12G111100 [Saponaria officinalis]|uniref:Uncharacterized protein n=1 Tax=Saponaria officinalis TaxID=3572 RepID=A0AAW1H9B6_SAPOF
MESGKCPQVKKAKKKQVKDELDRIKQAEKKRRRLEKALATSAAIRSELEKKKQQKKEEQERLDEEGAAIAEAVALHVLLGEDSDDPRIVLKEGHNLGDWHHATNVGLFMDGTALSRQNLKRCSVENAGWFPGAYGQGYERNRIGDFEFDQTFKKNVHISQFEDGAWSYDNFSAELIAAQAVASLQIRENGQMDVPVFFNRY